MKFHITITDNETGKTLVSDDTDAIICAYDEESGTTGEIVAIDGNEVCIMATAVGAIVAAKKAVQHLPKGHRKIVERVTKQRTKNYLKEKGHTNK